MNTEIVHSIHDIEPAEWERLAHRTGNLYTSHRWLAGEEDDPTAQPAYALVRDSSGTLLAAAPLYLVHDEPNTNYRPATDPVPRVIAGGRRGYHNAPLTEPDLSQPGRRMVLEDLRDTIRTFAHGHGTHHWWPYLTRTAADQLDPLYPRRPDVVEDDATIPLTGHGFDGYLAGLSSKRRVVVRRERAAFADAGHTVRILPLSDCYAEAGRLLALLQTSHGRAGDTEDVMVKVLHRQAEAMGRHARVVGAYQDGRMTGFALYYHYGHTTWLRAVGIDADRAAPFAYFNLTYYLPIEDAYRNHTTALHVGMKALTAKRLRGARTSPLYHLHDTPAAQPDLPGSAHLSPSPGAVQ